VENVFANCALLSCGSRGLAVERINPLPQFLAQESIPCSTYPRVRVGSNFLLFAHHSYGHFMRDLLLLSVSYLCGDRLLGGNSPCDFCCSVNTRTMNATSSSSESKCSAWCDTRCSTRPLKSPCSVCASACSCTTNALLAGREG